MRNLIDVHHGLAFGPIINALVDHRVVGAVDSTTIFVVISGVVRADIIDRALASSGPVSSGNVSNTEVALLAVVVVGGDAAGRSIDR